MTDPSTYTEAHEASDDVAAWLAPCGSCDAGLPMACTCPTGGPRNVIAALVAKRDHLTALVAALHDVTPHAEWGEDVIGPGRCISCGEEWMCQGYINDLANPDLEAESAEKERLLRELCFGVKNSRDA